MHWIKGSPGRAKLLGYKRSAIPLSAGDAPVEVINKAQRERAAARAELERAPVTNLLTDAEVYAMIDSLGDVGAALSEAKRDSLVDLYTGINLRVLYEPREM